MNLSSRNNAFIAFSLAILFVMAKPILGVIRYALDPGNTAASHIVLIPFISGTLIYLNRKTIFQSVRYSILPGALVTALGLVLFVGASVSGDRLAEDGSLAMVACSC